MGRKPQTEPTAAHLKIIEAYVRLGPVAAAKALGCTRDHVQKVARRWRDYVEAERQRQAKNGPEPEQERPERQLTLEKVGAEKTKEESSTALIRAMERAKIALIEARSLHDLKQVRDSAKVALDYSRAQSLAQECIELATQIMVEATTKIGREIEMMEKHPGSRFTRRGNNSPPTTETLADQGVDKNLAKLARGMARLERENNVLWTEAYRGHKTMRKALQEQYPPGTKKPKDDGKPLSVQLIDLSIAAACLLAIRETPALEPEEEIVKGAAHNLQELSNQINELSRSMKDEHRGQTIAVLGLLSEATRRHSTLQKFLEFARDRLARW